jgi:signal transduction histidine kinase/FixJ family two-component response regulator
LDSLVHSEDFHVDKHQLARLISNEISTYVVPKRFIRADGNIMYGSVNVSVARELDLSGNIILVVQDTTHSKEQETKIAAQQEALMHRERVAALGSLLAGVAHELNNPLAVVMSQTELLAETATDEKTRERAAKILKPVERCSRIIRTFLALARHRDTRKTSINIEDVISDVGELLEYQFRANEIDVVINIESGFPVIWGDSAQISQVLLNLLINSQQALVEVDHHRAIIIEANNLKENKVEIIVIDNGPGIPGSIRNRVFEPFFTTKAEGQGTGLGLSFCQNVAESHGGTIEIDRGFSSGTRIVFELPISEATASISPKEIPNEIMPDGSLRILVVDDETSLLDSIVEQLTRLGHSVTGSSNAQFALELVMNQTFDIVVTDIRMPVIDGPAFYDMVSIKRPLLKNRFIFITGDSLNQRASKFIDSKIVPCIIKPFKIADLNRSINEVINRNINHIAESGSENDSPMEIEDEQVGLT